MNNQSRKEMEILYDTYVDDIFRYLMFRLRNKEKALDLTQEVFIRMWQSYLSKDKKIDYPKSLLYRIAHNILVNSYERDKKHDSLDTLSEDGFEIEDVSQNVSVNLEIKDLNDALELLPDKYSELIIARHIEGFSVKEIAKMQEVSENVISVRLHRALEQLEKLYKKEE
jgi:RNA polymerase sigma-70 factor (ECF subfamily)